MEAYRFHSDNNNGTKSDEFKIELNRPFQCKWNSDVEHRNWIYCSGNVLILFGAAFITVILTVILVKHLRSQTVLNCTSILKVKTMILFLTIVHEFMVTFRYTFHFDGGSILIYDFILVI